MLDDDDGIYGMLTFLLEGVLLLAVALVGLLGNLISFVTIFRQKIQKTFHNLLFLLTVFDMVRVLTFLYSILQKCKNIPLFSICMYYKGIVLCVDVYIRKYTGLCLISVL